MAVKASNIFMMLSYPVVSCGLLLLLAFPLFQVLVYFFPLLISTALCVAAIVSVGPGFHKADDDRKVCDDKSGLLGRIRCLHESAKAWLESKFGIKDDTGSSQDEVVQSDTTEEEAEEEVSLETEHEKRVHQLERTLRTLSFVSYEGIFASDDLDYRSEETETHGDEVEKESSLPHQNAASKPPAEGAFVDPPPASEEIQEKNISDSDSQDPSSWLHTEKDQ